jgi:exodeoxyribonuclease V alpha subunit
VTEAPREAEQHVQLTVDEIVFRGDDGRFAIVRGVREPDGAPLTAVGDLGAVSVGETLRLQGRHTTHPVHGPRFVVHTYTPIVPTSRAGIARYLGSGLVPGIGPALAERLVARFGEQTLDVIAHQSARLREVSGIGDRRASAIAEVVRARREEAEAMSFLHALGLGPALARRVLRRYGEKTARVLREDPYRVAEQVPGIGFRTADRLGRSSGIAADDPRRISGAVLYLVGRSADEGHVHTDLTTLMAEAQDLDVPAERVPEAVADLQNRGLLVVDDGAIYAPPLHTAERTVATALSRLCRPRAAPAGVETAVAAATAGMRLAAAQESAVRASLECGLLVLTGGPGTGKTTTVRAIVRAHEALGRSVLLAAPTGRAAKRLAESTGRDARTIHRLLEWNPQTASFSRDAKRPLEADLVLVDEASMLDLQLAAALLEAIPPRAAVVLVGDVDQLPPVGAGHVLREVLASERAHVVRLTEVFRQAAQSRIVQGAHEVLRGRPPTPTPPGERGSGDLFVVRARDADAVCEKVVETVRRIKAAYGFDPVRDVQVLVPMRRGAVGAERLNEMLQAELNPPRASPAGAGPAALGATFRVGDKVMQLRNDYEREVFNGDLGEVRRIHAGQTYVTIDGREVAYGADDLEDLTLAYACTVHKAQGSEFPAVIIALHPSHWVLLDRALLYTAITRARRLVVIVGDERAVVRAAAHTESARSRSRLAARLRAAADVLP